ncbi:hypothetical protein KKC60_01555, partial [Patescibacteria group bacterium]|nr:hypothetical protein [Patescibacteria group bacterium]
SKETREGLEPGNFFLTKDNEFAIITGRGSIIPKELLLEGKKQLFNKDFVKGYGGKLENLDNQKNG